MAIPMELSQKMVGVLCNAARGKVGEIYKALVKSCNKGDDYVPTYSDLAAFRKKDIEEVLYYSIATRQDLIEMFDKYKSNKMEDKVIEYDSPLFGKVRIPISAEEEEVVVKTKFKKLEVTPEGKLDAAEKKLIIKKVKKKQKTDLTI